ncbi:MAG: hypothetical protein IKT00_00445 [Prevotella sp.]|nr:hypothetical protein [Prevotella sp.]
MIYTKKPQVFLVPAIVCMLLLGCQKIIKSILIQEPSTQYCIEYNGDGIVINYGPPDAVEKALFLFYKNGQYFNCSDSSLFLSNKDRSLIIIYDTLNHKKTVRSFQELYKDSIYVTENYNVPYDSLNYDYYSLKERDSVVREVFYYYDKEYKMVKIHRYNDIDDYVIE